jgi:hypothetical protein
MQHLHLENNMAEVQIYGGKTPEMKTYRCYELQQKQS